MSKILNRPLVIFTNPKGTYALKVNGVTVIDVNGVPKGFFTVAVKTNGTSAVNVFSSAGAPTAVTVTSVKTVSQDTSAANITLKQAANTVVTIAKGTASGGVVGGVSLANTVYAKGDACTVVSDGAHDAIVEIMFKV